MPIPVIETYPIGLLGSNVFLIYVHPGGEAAVVDPGLRDVTPIQQALTAKSLQLRYIINTHGHFDHVAGNKRLKTPKVTLAIHQADRDLLTAGGGGSQFGFELSASPEADWLLENGDTIHVDEVEFRVIHTPGHTRGSLCLYNAESPALLTGDTLFAGGIGRTDLSGGDAHKLKQSLELLTTLPKHTKVYPGHGPETTLADELRSNPWLRGLENASKG